MAFRELSALNKELYLRKQIDTLIQIYRSAQKRLSVQARDLLSTDFERYRAEALLKEVNATISVLDKSVYQWSKASIPQSYDRGIDLAAERLKALGVTRFVNYDAKVHTSAVSALVDDVSVELLTANEGMKKFFNSVIRKTQQAVLQDREISRMIAEGIIEGQSRRQVSDVLLKEFEKQLQGERFIIINGRNYRPDKYAELIARTRTREASSEGTINTALRYGVDLVQIDIHDEVCEYCQQFSGRIYSISGQDDDFPMLEERPPFHCFCKCSMIPITRRNLESRGYLPEMIILSNSPMTKVPSFSRFEEILSEY